MPLKQIAKFTIPYMQILDEEGHADERLDPRLSDTQLINLYEAMVLAREADQRMLRLQRQGRLGTFPPSSGQEATACGIVAALAERDWFIGSYRELGGRLMRSESLLHGLRYWNGYEEGNHQPQKRRNLPIAAIVGSQVPHAVGIAYAIKYRKEADTAAVTFFGDGATSQGDVHEAMNFAAVWHVPVVFVCMNNQWAISQPVEKQTRSETIAQKAIAYGFEGIQVDGNDVLACYKAAKAALDRARSGGGPSLIEAKTYRTMMHTTADDPRRYRSEDQEKRWRLLDPIERYRRYLERRRLWNGDNEQKLHQHVKAQIDETVRRFEAPNELQIDAPFNHIYAETHSTIEVQRGNFLADIARERDDG